jgi:hypothetical protein
VEADGAAASNRRAKEEFGSLNTLGLYPSLRDRNFLLMKWAYNLMSD